MTREEKIAHLKHMAAVCEKMADEADCRAEAHHAAGDTAQALSHIGQATGHRDAAIAYLEHSMRLACEVEK